MPTPKFAESEALVQVEGETAKAYRAFIDYINMGNKRSLRKLHAQYHAQTAGKAPTRTLDTIVDWSSNHQWQKRLGAYLQELAQVQAEKHKERLTGFTEQVWDGYDLLADHVKGMITELSNMKITKRQRIDDPQNPGQQIEVIRMRVNSAELAQLIAAFGQLGKDLRAQLGLPANIDITSKGESISNWAAAVLAASSEGEDEDGE